MNARACIALLLFIAGGPPAVAGGAEEAAPPARRVRVLLRAEGLGAAELAAAYVRPLERALASAEGVSSVRSLTRDGEAVVECRFRGTRDDALRAISSRTAAVARPADVPVPEVRDVTGGPLLVYLLSVPRDHPVGAADLAAGLFDPAVERIPGVARVEALGREGTEVVVEVDPARASARNLGLGDVLSALGEGAGASPPLFASAEDLRALAIGGGRLADVAAVRRDESPARSLVFLDGRPAAARVVWSDGTDEVAVRAAVAARLAELSDRAPRILVLPGPRSIRLELPEGTALPRAAEVAATLGRAFAVGPGDPPAAGVPAAVFASGGATAPSAGAPPGVLVLSAPGRPPGATVWISGPDSAAAAFAGAAREHLARALPRARLSTTGDGGEPRVVFRPDPERFEALSIRVADAELALRAARAGIILTARVAGSDGRAPDRIRVRYGRPGAGPAEEGEILVRGSGGMAARLADVGRFEVEARPSVLLGAAGLPAVAIRIDGVDPAALAPALDGLRPLAPEGVSLLLEEGLDLP